MLALSVYNAGIKRKCREGEQLKRMLYYKGRRRTEVPFILPAVVWELSSVPSESISNFQHEYSFYYTPAKSCISDFLFLHLGKTLLLSEIACD